MSSNLLLRIVSSFMLGAIAIRYEDVRADQNADGNASSLGQRSPCSLSSTSWTNCKWPDTEHYASVGDVVRKIVGEHRDNLFGINELRQLPVKTRLVRDGVYVLHDLDDTLICSGGKFPKGIDTKCSGTTPTGIYPGAPHFFYALGLPASTDASLWGVARSRYAIPFSARPTELRYILAMKKCAQTDLAIREQICKGCEDKVACEQGKCECFALDTAKAQYGSIRDADDVLTHNFIDMAYRKFTNFLKLSLTFSVPGTAVFIGDNGQGDLTSAMMMLAASQKSLRMIAAFIHDVALKCKQPECRNGWARHNIFFFADYGEAAKIAFTLGLLSEELASEVLKAAVGKQSSPSSEKEEGDDKGSVE